MGPPGNIAPWKHKTLGTEDLENIDTLPEVVCGSILSHLPKWKNSNVAGLQSQQLNSMPLPES